MVTNNIKWVANTIAPNPIEIDYWIDLSEDSNGGIIKYFDGTKWDYLNKMDEQDNAIAEEIERAQAAEQLLQANIDNVQDDVDSILLTGSDGAYTLMVGDRNAGTIEVGDTDLSSYATKTELEAKMDKAGGEFTGAVGIPNLAIMTDGKGAMVYLQSSSTEFLVRTANAGIDSMTFTVQSSVPLKLTESGIMENGVLLEDKYALLTDLDDFASKDIASTSANGLMSSTDKQKLDSVEENANHYVLPTATASVLGGVKQATTVADTTVDGTETATTVATTLNSLLAALRTAGILAS